MRITIQTEYSGNNRYLIRVRQDGQWMETLPAMRWTVVRVRNQTCAHYASLAEEVEANAIPEQWDM